MAFTKKNEEAVSPVIGVILMVAITVILAAVIAAFVFGMAGNVSKTKLVAITAGRSSDTTVVVTNNGGPDVTNLAAGGLSIGGDVTIKSGGNLLLGITTGSTNKVKALTGVKNRVLVTGTFIDGTPQVLLDTYV